MQFSHLSFLKGLHNRQRQKERRAHSTPSPFQLATMKEPLPPLENLHSENHPRDSRCTVRARCRAHGSARCIPPGNRTNSASRPRTNAVRSVSVPPPFHRQSLVPFWLSRQVVFCIFSRGATAILPWGLP